MNWLFCAASVFSHFYDSDVATDIYPDTSAFPIKHRRDISRSSIAKELAEFFLVKRNAMLFDQLYKIGGRIAGERRLREVRVSRNKILRARVEVGEIAAAAARDKNLLADPVCALEHDNPAPSFASLHGTDQAGSPGPENDDVVLPLHRSGSQM